MADTFWFCDTVTGEKQLQVTPTSGSWSKRIGGPSTGNSHTFQLGDRALTRTVWQDITTPWKRTLVVESNRVVVYAGIVTGRPWDDDSKTLTVNHVDLWSLLGSRYPFGVTSYNGGTLVCANLSLRSIAARIVQAGLQGPRPIFDLPIVFGALSESGPFSKTIYNYNFTTVLKGITDVQDQDGGPEIDFAPRWSSSDTLEWAMRTGNSVNPRLTGGTVEFNMSAPQRPLSGVKVNEDGLKQVTGVYAIGQGSEVDMAVGGMVAGTEPAALIPARETTESFKDIASVPELAAHSIELTTQRTKTTTATEFKAIDVDGAIRRLPLGSTFKLEWRGNEFIPDGVTTLRMVGLSGDMGDTVTPVLQEVGA